MTHFDPSPTDAASTRTGWRKVVFGGMAALTVLTGIFLAGPRFEFGPNMPAQRALPPDNVDDLDGWLAKSEAAFPDIKPGTAKSIVWAASQKQRTPWSVVYLHGFSASRMETAPLADRVATALGANAFHTRLTGHGLPGEFMGTATAQDWMADTLEAVRIGQALGERVLVISCSTGSTLATWLATSADGSRVAAHAFLSPNFGPKDKRSDILNGPWGQRIALALEGENRGWTPASAAEEQAWTSRYPTRALFPVMGLVKRVRESDLSLFHTPVLMLYSEQDETVDPVETQSAFTRIGSSLKALEAVSYSQSKGQHVLAGAIKDPQAVAPMAQSIVKWVQTLPKSGP